MQGDDARYRFHLARGDRAGTIRNSTRHDYRRVGAADRPQRLAHRSRRKQMAIAEAAFPINQHEVDVARQRAMLKRVVEDDHLGMREFAQQTNSVEAAARDDDWPAKRPRHHRRLIPGLIRGEFDAGPVGNQRGGRAVPSAAAETAAHDSEGHPMSRQAGGEKQGEGSFSITTDSQVADAYDSSRPAAFR